ncbi:MAG: hypothetical protein IT433_01825 [Phycisphaerales bacterium]|nr:hypothetical protein [Phycisphaerales bacterium]
MKLMEMVCFAGLALPVSAFAQAEAVKALGMAVALPPPPEPAANPTTEAKRVLGKMLFWDEILSSDNTVACATCHMPESGGGDPRKSGHFGPDGVPGNGDDRLGSPGVHLSTAAGDYTPDPMFGYGKQVTGRAAPPAIMAAYFQQLFWDGRASEVFHDPVSGVLLIDDFGALESQSVGPPLSLVEMAHTGRSFTDVVQRLDGAYPLQYATQMTPDLAAALAGDPTYNELFEAAFGTSTIKPGDVAKAIAAYERTLVPDQTPWDAFDAGDTNALTPDEIRGANAFDASACIFCHTPPTFSDGFFSNIGVRPVAEDPGRFAVTGSVFDRGTFKTPSLRNTELRSSFMHNGQFETLRQVVDFYAQTPGAPTRFDDNLHPVIPLMNIDPAEIPFIVQFMGRPLTDPRVAAAQFPFDHPTLFSLRAGSHITTVTDSGVPGSAGSKPGIIADSPPMIGNAEYRVGVYNAPGGALARLAFSSNPPSAGKIAPSGHFAEVTLPGSTSSDGHTTVHMPLPEGVFYDGQVLYLQWLIADGGAPGGESASEAVRLVFFCPRTGCTPACDPDVNQDGNVDQDDVTYLINVVAGGDNPSGIDPDFNRDGNADQDDVAALVNVVAGGDCP